MPDKFFEGDVVAVAACIREYGEAEAWSMAVELSEGAVSDADTGLFFVRCLQVFEAAKLSVSTL